MNAPANRAAFTAATRTAADPQPTVADSILRTVARMPEGEQADLVLAIAERLHIRRQLTLVQSIVEGAAWGVMCHDDGVAMDKALVSFAIDLDEADLAEHSRMHGPVEAVRSGYWL